MTNELTNLNAHLCNLLNLVLIIRGQYSLEVFSLLLRMLWNLSCAYNGMVRYLNKDELTLLHQPLNLGYECNFMKSAARSSKVF
jgi:hypothetical protein